MPDSGVLNGQAEVHPPLPAERRQRCIAIVSRLSGDELRTAPEPSMGFEKVPPPLAAYGRAKKYFTADTLPRQQPLRGQHLYEAGALPRRVTRRGTNGPSHFPSVTLLPRVQGAHLARLVEPEVSDHLPEWAGIDGQSHHAQLNVGRSEQSPGLWLEAQILAKLQNHADFNATNRNRPPEPSAAAV
jgi:hypothetical protein